MENGSVYDPVHYKTSGPQYKRVREQSFLIEGNRIFKAEEFETSFIYSDSPRVWHESSASSREDLNLQVSPSELEKIGLQADFLGKISLKKQPSKFLRDLKTTAKYALGIGTPLLIAYFIADYITDMSIQNYITDNLDKILGKSFVSNEDIIRNNPEQYVPHYGFVKSLGRGLGLITGGFASLVTGAIIREGIRTKKSELKKIKKILIKHERNKQHN